MFNRSANNERTRVSALRAGLFALALAMPSVAMADPQEPLLMDPTYTERAEFERVAGCAVTVTGLTDNRRAPETIGIVPYFRSIAAPADREAWFRSVIETGLRARGFTPTFALVPEPAPSTEAVATDAAVTTEAVAPAPAPEGLTLRVRLQSVWLASMGLNKTGSVVLHMSAAHGAEGFEGYYRGEHVSTNWNNGRGEFNEHLDRTFAEALDAMASDLASLCASAT